MSEAAPPPRIGVIVPVAYSGGTIRGALMLVCQLHDGARAAGVEAQIEFGYVDTANPMVDEGFAELEKRGIAFRPIVVEQRKFDKAIQIGNFKSRGPFIYFRDGVANFDDCDFLIIVSDRIEGFVYPTYRYGVIAYDFLQRYVPEILQTRTPQQWAKRWKAISHYAKPLGLAEAVFVTTNQAAGDATSFAGVAKERVVRLPMTFTPPRADVPSTPATRPYIIWTTNPTAHKNHMRALEGLAIALEKIDVDVVVTGVATDRLDPKTGTHAAAKVIASTELLSERLHIKGNLSDHQYVPLLARASLLFHPAIFDNGTYAILEAAWYGVPSVSSKYAAIEEIANAADLSLTYFDWKSPRDIADKICDAYERREILAKHLPTRERLLELEGSRRAEDVWRLVREGMRGRAA